MRLGAVIVVGNEELILSGEEHAEQRLAPANAAAFSGSAFLNEPLECVDIVGRSLVERTIERFTAIDIHDISVLVDSKAFLDMPNFRAGFGGSTVEGVSDLSSAMSRRFADYSREGIDRSFVIAANTYTETDLLDLFCFHRESRQAVTNAFDKEGSLPLWVVDCAKAQDMDPSGLLDRAHTNTKGASNYFIRDYASRLRHVRDMRRLTSDILRSHCQTGPSGKQIRPGVWVDDGAEIHRRARIVAPAYIGRESMVRADALITRCSAIERNCCIDCGTVIEDSSILPNTNVGICLDLREGVASGNKLWNLERDVMIEISDPNVMHSNPGVNVSVTNQRKRTMVGGAALRVSKPNGHSMAV
ncbi:MAG TPA: hypothetical protein VK722_05540 [Candidatus Aquilonibacter sp.]|nr:hypothetical protein [Candidatus Aquilonibacter sp.]